MMATFRINNVLVILAQTNGVALSEHQFCRELILHCRSWRL